MSTCLNANHFWLCRQKFYLVVGIFLAQPAVGLRSNVLFYNSNSNHVTNLLLLERSSNEIIKKIVRIFRIVDRIPHPHTFFDFCFTSVPKAIVEIEFVGHQATDVDLRQITKIETRHGKIIGYCGSPLCRRFSLGQSRIQIFLKRYLIRNKLE